MIQCEFSIFNQNGKDGRRIPLMKKAAIPFGLCALLMFFVPINGVSGLNAVWIAAFMLGYYFFFTLYMIPHNALIPELIQDGPLRVNAYTISSFFFVTGSSTHRYTEKTKIFPLIKSTWQ